MRKEIIIAVGLGLIIWLALAVVVIKEAERQAAKAIQGVSCTPTIQETK